MAENIIPNIPQLPDKYDATEVTRAINDTINSIEVIKFDKDDGHVHNNSDGEGPLVSASSLSLTVNILSVASTATVGYLFATASNVVAATPTHNNTLGLQGGSASERYHLGASLAANTAVTASYATTAGTANNAVTATYALTSGITDPLTIGTIVVGNMSVTTTATINYLYAVDSNIVGTVTDPLTINTINVGNISVTTTATVNYLYAVNSNITSSTVTATHNDLNDIQGGSTTERYHLTLGQRNSLATITASINTLETNVSNASITVSQLNTKIAEVSLTVKGLTSAMLTATTSINNIQTNLNTVSLTVQNLVTAMLTATTSIVSLQTQITAVSLTVSQLKTNLNTVSLTVQNLSTIVQALSVTIISSNLNVTTGTINDARISTAKITSATINTLTVGNLAVTVTTTLNYLYATVACITVTHNTTKGLQGGITGEYYHTTSAQNTAVGLVTASITNLQTQINQISLTVSTDLPLVYITLGNLIGDGGIVVTGGTNAVVGTVTITGGVTNPLTVSNLAVTITATINYLYATACNLVVTPTHNNLNGIQGGTTNEYYHLTNAEHINLTGGVTLTVRNLAVTQTATINYLYAENSNILGLSDPVVLSNLSITITATVNYLYAINSNIIGATTTATHNTLNGIQGGGTNEYYHLTSGQVSSLITTTTSINNLETKVTDISLTVSQLKTNLAIVSLTVQNLLMTINTSNLNVTQTATINYLYATSCNLVVTPTHNNTLGKQGGITNEYYHITSAQNTAVSSLTASISDIQIQINEISLTVSTDLPLAYMTLGSLVTTTSLSILGGTNAVIGTVTINVAGLAGTKVYYLMDMTSATLTLTFKDGLLVSET